MSGSKQHHIPQSLLKGFAISTNTKRKRVHVFSKEKCYISPTQDVAAERYFYSNFSPNDERTLDDIITEYENTLADRLASLRDLPLGHSVDALIAAEVVAHLAIRNAHVRGNVASGFRSIIGHAIDVFCSEANLRALLGVEGREFPPLIAAMLDEHMASEPHFAKTGLPHVVLHKIAFAAMRENFARVVVNSLPVFRLALHVLESGAPKHVAQAHRNALSGGLTPGERVARLAKLHWTVIRPEGNGIVLPDCIALGIEIDAPPQSIILADQSKLSHVIMPLAPDRALVGSRNAAPTSLVSAEFNAEAAACSHAFFISNRGGPDLENLAATIGERSQQTVSEAVAAAFDGFRREHELSSRTPVEGDGALIQEQPSDRETGPVSPPSLGSYQMSFLGVRDKETADSIGGFLEALVRKLLPMLPLDRLDGFTFAQDYGEALRTLDRGFEARAPLSPTKEEYGIGVAMTPLVVRDGIIKSRVVAQMWVAEGLISEDEDIQQLCTHAIVEQLAHVACIQLFDETLPGTLLRGIQDGYEAFLYQCIDAAWSGYFGARASAILRPAAGGDHRELVLASLRRAQSAIPGARLEYRHDGDLEKMLGVALSALTAFLTHLGRLLGHDDGLSDDGLDDPELEDALEAAGLRSWVDLFRMDLALVWARRGDWASIDEFLILNRHVERILWCFGLFPSKTDDDEIYVHVPLGPDAAYLYASNLRSTPTSG